MKYLCLAKPFDRISDRKIVNLAKRNLMTIGEFSSNGRKNQIIPFHANIGFRFTLIFRQFDSSNPN